jgi:hypothetical protein
MPVPANAAFATFAANLASARNVIAAGRNLEGLGATAVDIGDLYRGALLQAVSVLDTFMHAEILRRVEVLAQSEGPRPRGLDEVKITVRAAEEGAPRQLDHRRGSRRGRPGRQTGPRLQRPKAISQNLRYVTDHDVWPPLAAQISAAAPDDKPRIGASDLIRHLNAVVERRNQIAHGADLLPDGSGQKRAISAADVSAAVDLIEAIGLGLNLVLGDLPEKPDVADGSEQDSTTAGSERRRSRNSVLLIQEQGALPEETQLDFRPSPAIRKVIGAWLDEDPKRSVALWNPVGKPLLWAVDGDLYSPTGLIKKMYALAGAHVPSVVAGPDFWFAPGLGNLYEIGSHLNATASPSLPQATGSD